MPPRRAILSQAPRLRPLIEVRGPSSGHLYGKLDPERMTLEVKRKGGTPETIDLKALLKPERNPN